MNYPYLFNIPYSIFHKFLFRFRNRNFLAGLVADRATGFARGLARRRAFAAAGIGPAFNRILRDDFDMFHNKTPFFDGD